MPAPTKRIKSTSGDFSDPKTAILINQPATQWEGTVVPGEPKPAPKKRVQSASNDFSDPKTAVLIEQPATQWNTMLPEKNAGKRLPSSATSAEFGDPKTGTLLAILQKCSPKLYGSTFTHTIFTSRLDQTTGDSVDGNYARAHGKGTMDQFGVGTGRRIESINCRKESL